MITTQATATVTYRKTKAGEWVAFGPATAVREGYVQVTKRSGETRPVLVERVGRTFLVGGVEMVYGYIASEATAPAPRTSPARAYSDCDNGHVYYQASCFCCRNQIGL